MSSQRRGSLPTVLSPAPSSLTATGRIVKTGLTPECMEAMQVMNETNMSYACDLLLSERDYDDSSKATSSESSSGNKAGEQDEEKSDHTKLLELFSKCQSSLKIISKQVSNATVPAMPTAPSLAPPAPRGGVPGPRHAGLPKLKQKSAVATTSKQGVIPLRRGMNMAMTMNRTIGSVPDRPSNGKRLERETSHSSLADESSISSTGGGGGNGSGGMTNNSAKKARLSPPTTVKDVMAPPPSALNFLAKLNKDAGGGGGSSNGTNSTTTTTTSTTTSSNSNNTAVNSGNERGRKPSTKPTRRGST